MAQLDLPLPEITMSDFERSWTRFELVASAKEWNDTKKKLILPTLLRGKLVLVKIGIDPPLIATEFFSLYITPIKCVDHHIKNALEYTKGKCRNLKGLCDIYEVFMKPYKLCCLHHINAS